MTPPRDLLVWGATGQARVLAEFVGALGYGIVALVDRATRPSPIPQVSVLAGEEGFRTWLLARGGPDGLAGAVAIGGVHGGDRREVARVLGEVGLELPVLIHPAAFVAGNAEIGAASQVLAMARLCAGVRIGYSVIVNTGASIDHDGVVGDGAHLAPGAILAGEVTVERDAFVGAGAVVLPRLTIGEGAVVGAGAVVTRSVAPFTTVVGNPARPIARG